MHVAVLMSGIDPGLLALTLVQRIVDGGMLSMYANTSAEAAMFLTNVVTTVYAPFLSADTNGYNSGNELLVAKPTLSGVQLQWSYLFEPYSLNFVQYRLLANLTLAVSGNDPSGFTTLPMAFQDASTFSFLVPRSVLVDGMSYEFRLGFQFPTFTYYTNTLIAKTFDENSPFVGDVQIGSTNETIIVSWLAPEYSDGLIGYAVKLSLADGFGTVVQLEQVSSTVLNTMFGCTSSAGGACLTSLTDYVVSIAVIRETGTDSARSYAVSTVMTVENQHDTATIFLYGGVITLHFVGGVSSFGGSVAISGTVLYPAFVSNARGDVGVWLNGSMVQSVSSNVLRIMMSEMEWKTLAAGVVGSSLGYSPLSIRVGSGEVIALGAYCL